MCHRKNLRENNTNDTDKQILIGYIKKNSKVLGNSSPYRWKNIEELDNCKHACGFAYNVTINKKLHKYLMLFLSRKPLSFFELYHFFHWKCEWIEKNQIVLPTTYHICEISLLARKYHKLDVTLAHTPAGYFIRYETSPLFNQYLSRLILQKKREKGKNKYTYTVGRAGNLILRRSFNKYVGASHWFYHSAFE